MYGISITTSIPKPLSTETLGHRTGNSFAYCLGCGLGGDQWLRMWDGCPAYDIPTRLRAAKLGMRLMGLVNLLDDEIDKDGMSPEDRIDTLRLARQHTLDGVCRCAGDCNKAFLMARQLHGDVIGEAPSIVGSLENLFEAGSVQLESSSTAEQHAATISIGESCMVLCVKAGEFVVGKSAPPPVVAAGASLGAYSYLLDTAYEIEEDIAAGHRNYATILARGGEPVEDIQNDLLLEAESLFDRGTVNLSQRQERIYCRLGDLIALKYRLQESVPWLI